MTIKATSMLSILAIWVASIAAVVANGDSWWLLIFAVLATGAVGASAWRRLGISRLTGIAGTWAATGVAAASDADATWVSIFAFLTTGAVVYSTMKRDAWMQGLGIAVREDTQFRVLLQRAVQVCEASRCQVATQKDYAGVVHDG